MRTNAYIDGFNLYYGCFKHDLTNHAYKWLDLRLLCAAILPEDQIQRVHYFTAMVAAVPWNLDAPLRQETYIRALRTRPLLYVHLGRFQAVTRTGNPVGVDAGGAATTIAIQTFEEKGSDVNLATRLLMDAMDGDFEQALVISNDSDLTEPIRVARQRFNVSIIVVSPFTMVTNKLRRAATSWAVLDQSILARCQLPTNLRDKKGRTITKPTAW